MGSRSAFRLYDPVKRALDILFSAAGLIIFFPVLLIVAVLVRFRMGSPVLFIQERPGMGGRIFRLYKFRTMMSVDTAASSAADELRLPAFGKLLRSTSLDELPELWNVLKGEMSIVGPRPLLVSYLSRYSAEQSRRHEVRPGITGLAQVSGRNLLSWEERFALDVQYVDNRSLILDLKIILLTIKTVVCRSGISAEGSVTMTEFKGSGHE